jgi:hypothetical protein
MRAIVLSVFIAAAAVSCRDSFESEYRGELYCGVADPLHDLAWLREEVRELNRNTFRAMDVFVMTAGYRGEPVFFVDVCCPACTMLPPEVKDCQGNVLGRLGDRILSGEVVNRSILWQTQNGVCTRD